jgi:hypothetical protein
MHSTKKNRRWTIFVVGVKNEKKSFIEKGSHKYRTAAFSPKNKSAFLPEAAF